MQTILQITNQSTLLRLRVMTWLPPDQEYVSFIVHNAVPKAVSFDQVVEAAGTDPEMDALSFSFTRGTWRTLYKHLKPCYKLRGELTVGETNVALWGNRLVLPKSL